MMPNEDRKSMYTKDAIHSAVLSSLQEIAPQESGGTLRADTLLGAELGLKSLDFVRFVSALQQRYPHKLLPFQGLFMTPDGNFKQDVRISDLVHFLHTHLND